ncbi:MAG: DUF5011 domain-containing protein [Ruminococcaceae bacterium]|nr:DUF5011 domain-containing protein [Oscillospiraceae bacterium]
MKEKFINNKGKIIGLCVILAVVLLVLLFCCSLRIVLEINGARQMAACCEKHYIEPGATAFLKSSLLPGFSVELPVTAERSVEADKITVQYQAKSLWLTAGGARSVRVADEIAPVITLIANPGSFTLPGQPYEEEGYTAVDNCDGDLTNQVQRQVTDTEIIYTVTDAAGNIAEVRRTIVYGDPVAPELTLSGEGNVEMFLGTKFQEPGYTATDNCDGDLTAAVQVSGELDIFKAGTYTLTYTVTDAYGNTTTASRTVTVKTQKQPDVVDPGDKVIYLTFDDGPCSHTDRLLDILEKYNVKATFFVTNQSAYYSYEMKRIVEDGHAIGIHTYTHEYKDIYSSKEAFFEDFNAMRQLIYDETGVWTTLTRFPGGSGGRVSASYCPGIMTELAQILTDMGFQYFDWNVSSEDTGENKTAEAVYEAVIAGIQKRNVSCVLQHDIRPHSVDAVEAIIQWGLANGYTFLPLEPSSPVFHQNIRN